MTVAAARPHSDAVVAALEAVDLLVGRGQMPPGAGWRGEPGDSAYVPYVLLWPLTPHVEQASLAEPYADLRYEWQLTAVAASQDGAMEVMDIARAALVGQQLTVVGRQSRRVQDTVQRPAERLDTVTPPIHSMVGQFSVITSPA